MTETKYTEDFRQIYLSSPALLIIVDEDRRVCSINRYTSEYIGESEEEVAGGRLGEALRCVNYLDNPKGCGFGPICTECPLRRNIEESCRTGKSFDKAEVTLPLDHDKRRANGRPEETTFLLSTSQYSHDSKLLCLVLLEDITDRKQEEDKLKSSEERFRTYVEEAQDIVYETDLEGYITYISPIIKIITGLSAGEFIGEHASVFAHEDDKPRITEMFVEVRENGRAEGEFRMLYPDESTHVLHAKAKLLYDDNLRPKSILVISRDVTEKKRTEEALRESEARYKRIFNNSAASLWEEDYSEVLSEIKKLEEEGVSDFEEYFKAHPEKVDELIQKIEVIDVNDATLEMFAAESKKELLGYLGSIAHLTEANRRIFRKELITIAEGSGSVEGEIRAKRLDGTFLDIMIRINILYSPSTETDPIEPSRESSKHTMLVAISDISPLKKVIHEKADLMKELNHRVKNNLYMVNSLIRLKESDLGNEVDLSDIENQIAAIRLVHEKLHRSDEISEVSLGEYIEDLLREVFHSFSKERVYLDCRFDEVAVHSKRAVSLGLIVNEVATNAIKYGFNEEESPWFKAVLDYVSANRTPDSSHWTPDSSIGPHGSSREDYDSGYYLLTLENSGNPFPEEIDFDHCESLGLRLIRALVSQIDGTVELKKHPHPVFSITFPAE